MRKAASIAAIVFGILCIAGGATTWFMVSNELANQRITTSEDACLPGRTVAGPFTAYCEAEIIEQHALDATGGRTYAELDRDDPLRQVAASASFLRASLYTSIVAFGVAALAIGIGVLFILIGLGIRDVEQRLATE